MTPNDIPEPTANPFKLAGRWIRHKSAQLEHQTHALQEATKTPRSWVESMRIGGPAERWQDRQAIRTELEMYRNIRVDGGIIATLLEVRSLMVFGVGGEWDAEDEEIAEWMNENLPGADTMLHDIGLDTYSYGYALAEVQETEGGDFNGLVFLEPWTTTPVVTGHGEIEAWTQEVKRRGGATMTQTFQPGELMHFKTMKSSARDEVGMSLLGRALDEAETFRDDQRSIRNAIKLYGYPKLHAKIGREGGAVVDDNELRRTRPMFQDIDEETLWITGRDVDIEFKQPSNFDFTGVTEHDLAKLAIVFMLPLEITQLGGGEGLGTGFPARIRERMFLLSAKAHQKMLSNQLRDQVAMKLLVEYGGFTPERVEEAKVRFHFQDPITDMDQVKAKVEAVGPDMTVNERRGMFDLAPIEDEDVGEAYLSPGKQAELEMRDTQDPFDVGGFFQSHALQEAGISTEVLTWIAEYAKSSEGSVDRSVASFIQWVHEFADTPDTAVERVTVAVAVWAASQGITTDQAREQPVSNLVRFLERHRNLAQGAKGDEGPFEWEPHIDYMSQKVAWGPQDRALFGFSEGETPEFVKDMLLRAINDSDEIFADLETLSASATREFRNYMAGELSSDGWTISSMKNELQRLFNVTEQEAEVLARSTTQNVVSNAADMGYRERDDFNDLRFDWRGPDDSRTSKFCETIKERVPSGGLPLDDLKDLVQEVSRELGGEPRGYSPHPQCRHRPLRVVG